MSIFVFIVYFFGWSISVILLYKSFRLYDFYLNKLEVVYLNCVKIIVDLEIKNLWKFLEFIKDIEKYWIEMKF